MTTSKEVITMQKKTGRRIESIISDLPISLVKRNLLFNQCVKGRVKQKKRGKKD